MEEPKGEFSGKQTGLTLPVEVKKEFDDFGLKLQLKTGVKRKHWETLRFLMECAKDKVEGIGVKTDGNIPDEPK